MADTTTTGTAGTPVAEQPKQGLEKAQRTEIITTPTQFEAAIAKWSSKFHVLSPFTQITGLAPQHGIIASVVKINPDPRNGGPGEVYAGLPFLKEGEVAIAKIGLRKIADAGAISTTTFRTDPRNIPNYWEYKCVASYRGIDGTVVTREASAEWDLRDNSPRLKGWTANQISEGRKNGLRNCETRAINAAIRELGIKQKYSQEELAKPFLVLRVAFQPDMNDPEQRRIVTENAMKGTSVLYGAQQLPPGGDAVDADIVDDEPRHVGSGSAEAGKHEKSDSDKPPVRGAVRVEKVEEKTGTNEKTKRAWKRWDVVDSNGDVASTFDSTLGGAAMKARDDKSWVELVIEQNGNFRNLIEIIPAGSEPKLPSLENL